MSPMLSRNVEMQYFECSDTREGIMFIPTQDCHMYSTLEIVINRCQGLQCVHKCEAQGTSVYKPILTEGMVNKKRVETSEQWLPHKVGQAKVPKVEK